jgi:hypothetical protein
MAACRRLFYLLIRTRLDEAHTMAYKLRTRQLIGAACSRGIILSYPKSGRTWVESMLSNLYVRRFALPDTRILDFQDDREELPGLPYFFFTHDYAHVTHGQWLIPQRRSRLHFRATPTIFIVRYPIDTAVSMYFQQSRRERNLDEVEIYDFVATHQGGLQTIIEFMNFWARELPQIHTHKIVRYEDLSSDTYQSFEAIIRFLNLDFDDTDIRKAVEFARFDNLQQLEKEGKLADWRFSKTRVEDQDDMKVRRGKVGGYKDYFDEVQCKELERIVTKTLDPVYGY